MSKEVTDKEYDEMISRICKVIGALHMEDYSGAKWMIEYRGPSNLIHFHRNGQYEAKTLMEGEIKFYK